MFNFYVVSAGHDMVTDAGRGTTCRRKINPHDKKSTKIEGSFEDMGFNGKTVWRVQTNKEQKHYSWPFKKPKSNTRTLKASFDNGFHRQ